MRNSNLNSNCESRDTPLINGGVSHSTHRVEFSKEAIIIKPRMRVIFVYYSLFVLGCALFIKEISHWYFVGYDESLVMIFVSLVVISVGVFGFRSTSTLCIPIKKNLVISRTNQFFMYPGKQSLEFGKPVAVQIIKKMIGAKRSDYPSMSIELNMIFDTGNRFNLLQDRNLNRIESDAKVICDKLELELIEVEKTFDI